VYLKKMEMFGFKSFVDRTEFHFKPGMTGIVGPNGCGKSNVVDAFKWIFGSQSAKSLRGSEMKDVIFNGTLSRKPSGFSEVTVIFDNQDRFLDIDYAEVAITRRLFRSGESEYLINRQKCRRKDIKDLFLDTGVGQTSYSILEQGKIDVLLQSSPTDRRVIFEEAAGISKYRVKKAEALRALMRVEDNLERLQDIVDEVGKRIRRVKSQATKAKNYREMSDLLKELRVRTALEDYHDSLESRVGVSFGLYWANHSIASLDALEGRLHGGLEEQLKKRQPLLSGMRDLREKISLEVSTKERARERIDHAEKRLQELAEEECRKQQDLEETLQGLDRLRHTIEEAEKKHRSLAEEIELRGRTVIEATAALEEKQETQRRNQEELEAKKNQVVSLIQQRSRIANFIVQVSSELKNLRGRKERLENAIQGFRIELEESGRRGSELGGQQQGLVGQRETLEAERENIVSAAAVLEEGIEKLAAALATEQEALHRKSSRYDVLESFEERLDGIATGVQEILKRRQELPAIARSHGIAASLLRVERRYARAVEAALGGRAQSLVVETQEGALELLRFVQEEGLGGVETIVLERVDHVSSEYFPKHGGVLGNLREVVQADDDYQDLFDRLLANVVLVEDLPTAVALSRNGLRPFRLVTLAGEVVEPWGGLAVSGPAETGIISRRSEMEELRVEVAELEKTCDSRRQELSGRRQELSEHRASLEVKIGAVEAVNRRVLGIEGELGQVHRDSGRVRKEIEVSTLELAEVEAEIAKRVEDKNVRSTEVQAVDRERVETEESIRTLEEVLAELTRAVEVAADATSQSRLELAQSEKQEEGLRELCKQQSEVLEERERHANDVRSEISTFARRARETAEIREKSLAELETVDVKERALTEELIRLENEDRSLSGTEKAFREEIDKVHAAMEEARSEREDYQLRDQEGRHRRNTILERLEDQYGINLKTLLDRAETRGAMPPGAGSPDTGSLGAESGDETAEPAQGSEPAGVDGGSPEERFLIRIPPEEREAVRERVKELQDKIERLGNVNLEALEELEELEERHHFQSSQKEDLVQSERNLRGIIADINRKSREMFLETFGQVQQHFGDLFRKCFGGGRAELVIDDNTDVLEAGIEIVARPPGKKLTSLSLMSGGEKTMTTIALLLAIFRSRPSPFCVLDEVDAPLDDANVRRFVVLLKEFVEQSQFIIITHNKVTMAEAGTLYGVTMEERGVSKRVAVELETYDPERMELAATGLVGEESRDGAESGIGSEA